MPGLDRRHARLFDEVAALYDRVRPGYPDELFADLATLAEIAAGPGAPEVGYGTGEATAPLAGLGCRVTAVEAGPAMAVLARVMLARLARVEVETSTFEEWDDRGRRLDALVATSSWHGVDPSVGWPRTHELLRREGRSRSSRTWWFVARAIAERVRTATADPVMRRYPRVLGVGR